ncbi:hypothetical protein [Mesobacterium pallidum]|uniref:hypothetical protein n=1 Tax=Mesobacterium pallidum TaxID=2872037 RepID=UPI001EE32301|nr:hypothetical protein [Mesobacterium pallidum]
MSDEPDLGSELTYKGGFGGLLPGPEKRRPYDGMAELLDAYAARGVAELWKMTTPAPRVKPPRCDTAREKLAELAHEFQGRPMALTVHALTIAAARRQDTPEVAGRLFRAIWTETPYEMLDALDMRWRLSAIQTFVDFGTNEVQRRAAARLTTFFQVIKLYEAERLYSRFGPGAVFKVLGQHDGPLPYGLKGYSMRKGDLDRNLLGTLWVEAEEDPVLRPLACRLLNDLNRADEGLFHRLMKMRRRLQKIAADKRTADPD